MFHKVALLGSFALSWPFAMQWLVEPVLERGERAGETIGKLYATPEAAAEPPTAPAPLPEPPHAEMPIALEGDALDCELAAEAKASPDKAHEAHTGRRSRSPATPKQGVRVNQASILRLAKARAVPRSRYVAKAGTRPAGLELTGTSALRIGMRDGDVLTHVAGTAVSDRGQVVNLVLAARARKAPTISARFYRGDEPWMLVVEIPYLPVGTTETVR